MHERTARLAARHTGAFGDIRERISPAAPHTIIAHDRPVKLYDVHAARSLMQTVYVLRNDPRKLSAPLELGKRPVRSVRRGVGIYHMRSVIPEKLFGLHRKTPAAEKLLGRLALIACVVKAVPSAEIRYSAACRNARAAEEHDVLRLADDLFKSGIFHCLPSLRDRYFYVT